MSGAASVAGNAFWILAAAKIATAIFFVVVLSLIAERFGPRMAGIAAGYPLGAAITLFFVGLEIGPGFAADSAPYTALGLVATQVFVFGYYIFSKAFDRHGRIVSLIAGSVGGLVGYGLTAAVLKRVPVNILTGPALALVSVVLFNHLFKGIENSTIVRKPHIGPAMLLLRALVAGTIIIVITGVAALVGPRWAGLLAAFPITMYPLLAIVHVTYGSLHVHTIIKNVPRGLLAVIVYSLAVYFLYPTWGVAAGTLAGYLAASVLLTLVAFNLNPLRLMITH